MALEPITRQEKIIAGQDLTPITRMEKFLKNFGGSGGGGGEQPDLSQTDTTKPDYVKGVIRQESLPDGYPYKEHGEILPETVVQIETANEHVNNPFVVNLTTGNLYKVVWDGIAYEVVAANIQGATAIGNAALESIGDDTGEPFIIASAGGNTILVAETAGSHTVSIIGEIIQPMDQKFLPAVMVVDVVDGVVSHTAAEIAEYLSNGGIPFMKITYTSSGGKSFFPFIGMHGNYFTFGGFNNANFKELLFFSIFDDKGETLCVKQSGTITMDKDFSIVT